VWYWEDVAVNQIQARHDTLYDGYDKGQRQEVDLEKLPLLDEEGEEIWVYNERGFRVPRRNPMFSKKTGEAGVMVDLRKVHDLFNRDMLEQADDDMSDDEFEDLPEPTRVTVYGYPQAFLHDIGHIQANGVPDGIKDAIEQLNNSVGRVIRDRESDSEDEDSDAHSEDPIQACPISGISCQFYNAIMHRTRPRTNQHDAQLGTITNALAGTHAKGIKELRRAKAMKDACL
jgi:hypothetical protein